MKIHNNSLLFVIVSLLCFITVHCCFLLAKDVNFCQTPTATYTQSSKYVSYYGSIRHHVYKAKIQYDAKVNKQRVDTLSVDDSVASSELSLLDSQNNTITYSIGADKSCSCVNEGQLGGSIWAQCITKPVLGKATIADMPALKVGYNTTNTKWTNDEYYWIVPNTKEAGYWWFLSQVEYVIDESGGIDMGTTTFYDHTTGVNSNAFEIPSNCPSMKTCPHPR